MHCYMMDHPQNKEYNNGLLGEIEGLLKNTHILGGGIGAIGGFIIARQMNSSTVATVAMIGGGHIGGHYVAMKYY